MELFAVLAIGIAIITLAMAAPTPTARTDPTTVGAKMLTDGYPVKFTLARYPAIKFKEVSLQPPGIKGDTPMEMTDQFNTLVRTKAFRKLLEITEIKGTASLDTGAWPQAFQAVNINDVGTFWWPDGSSTAIWGALTDFQPKTQESGKKPEVDFTFTPSNRDNAGAEQVPVHTEVTGT